MKSLRWMAAVAALVSHQPAQAGITDPEVIIYRISGVFDNLGTATAFHCTNFSGVLENLRFVVRGNGGQILANVPFFVPHLSTITLTTRATVIYIEDQVLNTGTVTQGTAAIAATSVNVTCTAMQVDAANSSPVGIALHTTRFNAAPGTQE